MELIRTEIDTPPDCVPAAIPPEQRAYKRLCRVARQDGSSLLVFLDEWPLADVPPSGEPDLTPLIDFAMNQRFEAFARESVSGGSEVRVASTMAPKDRLPRGMTSCRDYLFEHTHDGGRVHEKGRYCTAVVYGQFLVLIGAVGDRSEKAPPPDFEVEANRLLASFKLK